MKSYETGLAAFDQFRSLQRLSNSWPPKLETVVKFVAFLSIKGLSPNTAKSYITSIGFKCKIQGLSDVSTNFVVQKMLEGMKRLGQRSDTRLPITEDILTQLALKLPGVCTNSYESKLFRAAFSLAFWGLFRVGEITATKGRNIDHILAVHDITMNANIGVLRIHLRFSKTDQTGQGVFIDLKRVGSIVCPFDSMKQYLAARPSVNGPLFIHFNGKALTRYQFSAVLNKTLIFAGVNPAKYKSHSFRLGGATAMSVAGKSVDEIKLMGRWKSCAYKTYIRPN